MIFYYHGQPRLSLWSDSPNHCATVVAMLLVGIVAIAGTSRPSSRRQSLLFALGTLSLCVGNLILILTYSRGGWISYGCGLLFLAASAPRLRILCAFCAIGFLLGIIVTPRALVRAGSVADQEDRSITHRVDVWKGALAMTAVHPFTGLGVNQFGPQFSAWYQPLSMNTRYAAALNNYLTISVERGLFGLMGYLLIIIMPLYMAWFMARLAQNTLIIGSCAGLLIYAVSALFTCSLGIWYINAFACFLWLILILYVINASYNNRTFAYLKIMIGPTLICLIITSGIAGIGSILLSMLPTKVIHFSFNETHQNQEAVIIYPQNRPNIGAIIYFHGSGESTLDVGKNTLRPLAEKGFTVVSVDYRLKGRDSLIDACAILDWFAVQPEFKNTSLYLCGSDLGGRISILTACRKHNMNLKAIAISDADTEWPFPDLSPLNQIDQLNVPLLLLYQITDQPIIINEPQEFVRQARQKGKDVVFIVNNENTMPDDLWPNALNEFSSFFLAHP